jgi:hypothetical protein
VDGVLLNSTAASEPSGEAVFEAAPRVIGRINTRVQPLRANVQDAARAVLTWMSEVVGHTAEADLDAVLDRCLKPGPDIERVNYVALADEIAQATGISLSPKRVRTAILHLRRGQKQIVATPTGSDHALSGRLQELDAELRRGYAELNQSAKLSPSLRREMGTQILAAVRSAAGRVIDRDFGEGIPEQISSGDLRSQLHGHLLDVLTPTKRVDHLQAETSTTRVLESLLEALANHQLSASSQPDPEANMRLVLRGAKAVSVLLGSDSLAGTMAQLNVLVAGRDALATDLYVAEMLRLASHAHQLHDDADTQRYLNWARRLPEDRRLPSAIRVSSYCRSNAATRLMDHIYRGDLDPHAVSLADASGRRSAWQLAQDTHDRMLACDSGFTLTLTTQMIRHILDARLSNDQTTLDDYLQRLGPERTLDRFEALVKFENNGQLVSEAAHHIQRIYPDTARQLIVVQ